MADYSLGGRVDPNVHDKLLNQQTTLIREQLTEAAGRADGAAASASTIRVTPESLKKDSHSLYACASEIKKTTESITAMVMKLTGQIWSGSAQTAYVAKFKALQDQITPAQDAIIKHSENLDKIAEEYGRTESAAQKRSGELPTDVFGED